MTRAERVAYSAAAALTACVAVFTLLPQARSLFFDRSHESSITIIKAGANINRDGSITVPGTKYEREIYFNKPETLYYDESTEIVLSLESEPLGTDQVSLLFQNLDGKVEQQSVKVGAYLSANLSADPSLLNIVPSDKKLRQITPKGETKFAWFVRPVDIGPIPIRLDLLSQDSSAKDSAVRSVQVFQENWTATAKGINWAKYVLSEYRWGFTAIGGVLTFFGVNTLLKRRDDNVGR